MSGYQRLQKAIRDEAALKTAIRLLNEYASTPLHCGGKEAERLGEITKTVAELQRLVDEIND